MIETIYKKEIRGVPEERGAFLYLKKDDKGYFFELQDNAKKENHKSKHFKEYDAGKSAPQLIDFLIFNQDFKEMSIELSREMDRAVEKQESPKKSKIVEAFDEADRKAREKKEFNKASKEWARKKANEPLNCLSKVTQDTISMHTINPYKIETIGKFIDSAKDEEGQDNNIIIVLETLLKDGEYLAIERVIEYISQKYSKNKVTLNKLAARIEQKIKSEEKTNQNYFSKQVLKITNYIDNVKTFYGIQPFFYETNKLFWFWNNVQSKYEMVDEVDMMIAIEKQLGFGGETVTSGIKSNYLEAFKRVGRENRPKDAPKKWIQFKDNAFSLKSGKIYSVQPNYFFTNPIPWEIGESSETPTIDKLFAEWVGKEYIQTLYEIVAYCCYTDYPIQVLFCLYGIGRNGKTCFLRLLSKFISKDNLCSTDLDLLMGNNRSRFESLKLYKKLVCLMGETNFGVLSNSAMLKKLTGGDIIGFEVKGGKAFDDYSYAKLIIASNSLPTSEDTSEGFYRRWVIIDFPNQFPEGKDILKTVPKIEYSNLAKKVIEILPNLIEKGVFSNQGTVEDRKYKYIMASNPLIYFLEHCCTRHPEFYVRYSELFAAYTFFLNKIKRRQVSRKEFNNILAQEGFEQRKTSKTKDGISEFAFFIEGLGLNNNWKDEDFTKIQENTKNVKIQENIEKKAENGKNTQKMDDFGNYFTNFTNFTNISNSAHIENFGVEKLSKISKKGKIIENGEIIFHKCSICGTDTAEFWDKRGKPICDLCKKALKINER